jgi:hypothetical protein
VRFAPDPCTAGLVVRRRRDSLGHDRVNRSTQDTGRILEEDRSRDNPCATA